MSYVFGAVLLSTGGAEHDMAVEIQACSPRTVEGETRQRVFLRVALEDETLFDPKQGPRQVRQTRRTWFIRRLVWINSLAWISTSETCDCLNPTLLRLVQEYPGTRGGVALAFRPCANNFAKY